ncbi:MAG: Squalene synthase [Labilithrix sp.]|nr:Squalene synthase [Labilithrix sp.]
MKPETLDVHLQETSRTFALAVPLLTGRTRLAVGLAYLLFRCADTLEDAASWTPHARKTALGELATLLEGAPDLARARELADEWVAAGVATHAGYTRLLDDLPDLLQEVASLPPAHAEVLRDHARRTTLGMRDMIDASARGLQTIEELQRYCYIVAGIVGELLTATFVLDAPGLAAVRPELEREERLFGEGLQLVNILKDERADAAEGRTFLPAGATRDELLALAQRDLEGARRYIAALVKGGAPASFVAFTSLPCELAEETVVALRESGAGAKVPRARVAAMFERYYTLAHGDDSGHAAR